MTLDTQMTLALLPELSADYFDGLSAHSDAVTGGGGKKGQGDSKDQIASYRETLSDSEEAAPLVDFTLEPTTSA